MTNITDDHDDNRHDATDETPLLPHSRSSSPEGSSRKIFGIPRQQFIVTLLVALLVVWADFGSFLLGAPTVRIYEAIACRDWYRKHDPGSIDMMPLSAIPEEKCKLRPIQDRVANVKGWALMFDNIPAIIMALPMGALADKYGRKPAMIFNYLGIFLSMCWQFSVCILGLRLELVWASAMFFFIGGGSPVIVALLLSVLSDVTPETERMSAFFLLSAMVYASMMIAPPVASVLMDINVWLPVAVSFGFITTGVVFLFLMPETKDFEAAPEGSPAAARVHGEGEDDLTPGTSKSVIHRQLHLAKMMIAFMLEDINVLILVIAAMLHNVGVDSASVFLQYVSKRYGWTISQANFLTSLRAGFVLFLLLAVLPGISHLLLVKLRLPTVKKDLFICRSSIILQTLGTTLIGISPTPVGVVAGQAIDALGTGYSSALRSLATSLVDPHNIGRLYSSMAIFEAVGSIVAGPMLAALFRWGLKLGGVWLGIPFIFTGCLYGLMACLTFLVKPKARELAHHDG